jgi:hypothetical protein
MRISLDAHIEQRGTISVFSRDYCLENTVSTARYLVVAVLLQSTNDSISHAYDFVFHFSPDFFFLSFSRARSLHASTKEVSFRKI